MYTKAQQIGKRSKPKQSKRSQIDKKDYRKMTEIWGENCLYCGSPNIEAHHVKYRSNGGRGRFTNLLPLCQKHHSDAHKHYSIRISLENKLEQTFGADYWKDEYDLEREGKISNPDRREHAHYFGVMM